MRSFVLACLLAMSWVRAFPYQTSGTVTAVAVTTSEERAQVVIVLDHRLPFSGHVLSNPDRVYIDVAGQLASEFRTPSVARASSFLKRVRVGAFRPGIIRVAFDLGSPADFSVSLEENPPRLVVQLFPKQTPDGRKATADARSSGPGRQIGVSEAVPPVTTAVPTEISCEASASFVTANELELDNLMALIRRADDGDADAQFKLGAAQELGLLSSPN